MAAGFSTLTRCSNGTSWCAYAPARSRRAARAGPGTRVGPRRSRSASVLTKKPISGSSSRACGRRSACRAEVALPDVARQQHAQGRGQRMNSVAPLRRLSSHNSRVIAGRRNGEPVGSRRVNPAPPGAAGRSAAPATPAHPLGVGARIRHLLGENLLEILPDATARNRHTGSPTPAAVTQVPPRRRRTALPSLADQHPHGPAVGDDVMDREGEDVVLPGEPHQHRSKQRSQARSNGSDTCSRTNSAARDLRSAGRQRAQVRFGKRGVQRRIDHLRRRSVDSDETRAEHLVPAHDLVQRPPQGIDIECPTQPHHCGDVVEPASRLELIEKPQPLLRERQSNRPIPRHRHQRCLRFRVAIVEQGDERIRVQADALAQAVVDASLRRAEFRRGPSADSVAPILETSAMMASIAARAAGSGAVRSRASKAEVTGMSVRAPQRYSSSHLPTAPAVARVASLAGRTPSIHAASDPRRLAVRRVPVAVYPRQGLRAASTQPASPAGSGRRARRNRRVRRRG